ncbi:hypothetical protein Stsp02_24030 [Streptomyces sp. NBRC 14336]|uniref:DUF5666 domain-containing protein n=1 Tax=Streptomyces sp. NBRC 14336 TaxID=3030992 RepID=UPI0024A3A37E|nr:DUF5666 domain-containing protein [Streptomyces sp. NBRC 14336]WBO76150.1 DUF5666 domain-containing protein [Streptomyces sp. SBE_14.2]GLW46741.1 hypothetical protein Stsp02_24030 [Streptomyces sp. NBRC 14336]
MTHDPDQEPTTAPGEVLAHGPSDDRPRGLWRQRSARARTVTAATAVAVLALGGTVAYAATSDGSEGSVTPSASSDPSDRPGERHRHGPWFGLRGGGVHGEATVKDPENGDEWIVRVWQRGTVEEVDGDQVTVRSEDGTEWTWTVDSDTVVRKRGDSGALKDGDDVYLSGTRSDGGDRTADRVFAGDWEERDAGERRHEMPWHDDGDGDDDGPGRMMPWRGAA